MASGGLWGLFDGGMDFPRDQMPFQLISICFPLFGLPFVLIGLGMLTAPHWAKRKALRTAYAVTDRRGEAQEILRAMTDKARKS